MMFTQKEKHNIIIFALGVCVGIAISAIVAYFSVIANFTKDNIIKITNIFPSDSVQVMPTQYKEEKQIQSVVDTLPKSNPIKIQNDSLPNNMVKSDTKMAEEIIPIISVNDSSEYEVTSIIREIQVEQWDSPMNFIGYKLTYNLLIIYGIDLKNIELQYINGDIYLIVGEKRLILQETENFVRFPISFLK